MDPIYLKHPKHDKDEQPVTAVNEAQAAVFESVGWKRIKTGPTTESQQ